MPITPNSVPVGYEGQIKEYALSKNSYNWGGFKHGVKCRANSPCCIHEKYAMSLLLTVLVMVISFVRSIPTIC